MSRMRLCKLCNLYTLDVFFSLSFFTFLHWIKDKALEFGGVFLFSSPSSFLFFYSSEAKDHKENEDCFSLFLKQKICKKRAITDANDINTLANVYSEAVTLVVSNRITLISYPASKLHQHNGKLAPIENILISAEFQF